MTTHDYLLLSVVFYCVVFCLALVYVFVFRNAHVFEPAFQYLFFFSLFVLPLPIRALITLLPQGDVSDHLSLFYPWMPQAVALCGISIILFVIGYYSGLARWLAACVPMPQDSSKDSPIRAFVILILFSFILISILAGERGILGLLLLGYGSSAEMFGQGYLAIGFPWAYVATLFLLYRYAWRRDRISLISFGVAYGLITLAHLLMGNRSQVMYWTMVVLFFWHFSIQKISYKKIALIGISCFLFLNLVGLLRASHYDGIDSFVSRTSDSLSSVREGGDDSGGLLYTLTTGEFVVPFETLPHIMRAMNEGLEPWWGWSYIRSPVYAIPSAIYENRPLPLANWYMRKFYGSGYGANEGRQFFFLAEAYLNFGLAGVLIVSFLTGLFWGAVGVYLKLASNSKGAVLLAVITTAFIFRVIAGDFTSLIIGLPEQCLSAVFIGLMLSMRKNRWVHLKWPGAGG